MRNRNPNHDRPVLSLRGRTTVEDLAELLRKAEKALITFTPKQPADGQPDQPPAPTSEEQPAT
jgi:hypothetical protein